MSSVTAFRWLLPVLTPLLLAPVCAWARSAVPVREPAPAFGDEPWRAQAPTPGAMAALKTPTPQTFRVLDAIDVVLVERHQLPTVSMQWVLPGGAAWDPPGLEGLASVCMNLASSGTQKLDKLQLAEAQADLAADIGAWADTDELGLQLSVLSRNLKPALDLFADVLLRPGLREDELGRIVARRQASLVQARGTPASVAARVAPAVAFGPQNPRGRLTTQASLAAVTIAACKAHLAGLSPHGARLYVVGDVGREQLLAELTARLGAWKTSRPSLPPLPAPAPMAGRVFVVEIPGAEQSVINLQAQGPRRDAPDYEASSLMMGVLGSGFSSRINMNLREKHGWAYGAGGGFDYRRDGSRLTLQASVRVDATGSAIGEIFKEIKGMQAEPVSAEELARERQGAILSLPARWSTGRSIAATFQGLQYFGLPLDWYNGHVARLEAVDLAAVQASAKAHLDLVHASVLIVGDPAKLGPQLATLLQDGPLKGQTIIKLDPDAALQKP